jgi:hypothetical protein
MDNLEDFIKNNKEEFKTETPSSDVWKRIQAERNKTEVTPIAKGKRAVIPMQFMKLAASVLILALAAFGGYKLMNGPSTDGGTTAYETQNLPVELVELDQYYETQVRMSLTQINSLVADTSIINEVKAELQLLDTEKGKLFREYGDEMDDKQVVQALMNTYRMKLQVLENILSLLNENENEEDLSI